MFTNYIVRKTTIKMETDYIYFEIYEATGYLPEPPRMQNENFLLRKPRTNSDGVWGYTNITEHKALPEQSSVVLTQYWFDLEKYKPGNNKNFDTLLAEFYSKVRDPRAEKIKEILQEIFDEDSNGEYIELVVITEKEDYTRIDFTVYDDDREGTFENDLRVYKDGTVNCWNIHEIWEGGDVASSIEEKLTEFFRYI